MTRETLITGSKELLVLIKTLVKRDKRVMAACGIFIWNIIKRMDLGKKYN